MWDPYFKFGDIVHYSLRIFVENLIFISVRANILYIYGRITKYIYHSVHLKHLKNYWENWIAYLYWKWMICYSFGDHEATGFFCETFVIKIFTFLVTIWLWTRGGGRGGESTTFPLQTGQFEREISCRNAAKYRTRWRNYRSSRKSAKTGMGKPAGISYDERTNECMHGNVSNMYITEASIHQL